MTKAFGRTLFFVIATIIARFTRPKNKVKEVINVRYPVYKKAS